MGNRTPRTTRSISLSFVQLASSSKTRAYSGGEWAGTPAWGCPKAKRRNAQCATRRNELRSTRQQQVDIATMSMARYM
eukprot:4373517-Amphidinium_carterae.1